MRLNELAIALLCACAVACGRGTTSSATAERKSVKPGAAQAAASDPAAKDPGAVNSVNASAGAALAAEIQRKIQSDPRITSKDIQVTFEPTGPGVTYETIRLTGTVASDDEAVAAMSHARKLTTIAVSSMLTVADPASGDDEDAGPGEWKDPGGPRPLIPLCPGLTVVTAVSAQGDYESIKTIESVGPQSVRLKYSNESAPPWWSAAVREVNRLV